MLLARATVDDPHAPLVHRLNAAVAATLPDILMYAEQLYGRSWWQPAWDELWSREGVPIDADRQPEFVQLFLPWLALDWIPSLGPGERSEPGRGEVPAARAYLEQFGSGLSEFRRRFIEAARASRFSMFRVVKVRDHDSLDLEDLLTGIRYFVVGRIESTLFIDGDIIYARVVSMDGVATIVGSAPWCIHVGESFDPEPLRQRLVGTGGELGASERCELDRQLRLYFLGAIGELFERQQPADGGRAGRTHGDVPAFLQVSRG
jgi:hypothetical protein